jgi:xanthine dehydrogenase small subunit
VTTEAATTQAIRFVLDGEVVSVTDAPPTMTVLEYLRNVAGRTGTKEGCAEGDCGACTVVIGELNHTRTAITYRAINSCIRFLPTIDGKELVTAESLVGERNALHPVQQAMVDEHASQCGFCTPGFVMSLFALYLNQVAPSRETVVDSLAGNLCRCTGYRPIIDAGCRMGSYNAPSHWGRADAQSAQRIARLSRISRDASLSTPAFKAPRTLDEMAKLFEAEPESLLLAGGTDVALWVTKQLRDLPPLIYIGEVAELAAIRHLPDGLWIGAGVTLTRAWPELVKWCPALAEQARRFASPPICNSATLGGNIANGSPIGDSMPALMALGASVDLRRGNSSRTLALEQLYLGYQKKAFLSGEFVVGVKIPTVASNTRVASYKVAKRFDQDISAVSVGFAVTVEANTISDARLAFGGMAAIPARAERAEKALIGQPWSIRSMELAIHELAHDFKPLTDMRASSSYRLEAAGNLLRRFFAENSQSGTAVRLAQVVSA